MSDAIGWAGLTPDELAALDTRASVRRRARAAYAKDHAGCARARAAAHAGANGHAPPIRNQPRRTGGLKGWIGSNVIYAPFVHANVPFLLQWANIDQSAPER
jgi:hypothetical protein